MSNSKIKAVNKEHLFLEYKCSLNLFVVLHGAEVGITLTNSNPTID